MKNKRGLSTVVATVVLILITIVAIGIIIKYILPFVNEGLEGTSCAKYRDYFYFVEEDYSYNCYEVDSVGSRLYAITVGANSVDVNAEERVAGLSLAFISLTGESQSVEVRNGQIPVSSAGGIRKINVLETLEIPKNGEVRTYVYNGANENFTTIWVAPIIKKESGEEQICEKSDSIKISGIICSEDKYLTQGEPAPA